MEEITAWKIEDRFETDKVGFKNKAKVGRILADICNNCPFFDDCMPLHRAIRDRWQVIPHYGFNHNIACYFNRINS